MWSNVLAVSTRGLSRNILRKQGLQWSRCLSSSGSSLCPNRHVASPSPQFTGGSLKAPSARHFRTSSQLWKQTVKVPPFADSVSEGDAKLIAKVGDQVKVDQVVMEIETDKTAMPVPAPCNGVIKEILVKDGDTVKPGQDLFTIEPTA